MSCLDKKYIEMDGNSKLLAPATIILHIMCSVCTDFSRTTGTTSTSSSLRVYWLEIPTTSTNEQDWPIRPILGYFCGSIAGTGKMGFKFSCCCVEKGGFKAKRPFTLRLCGKPSTSKYVWCTVLFKEGRAKLNITTFWRLSLWIEFVLQLSFLLYYDCTVRSTLLAS